MSALLSWAGRRRTVHQHADIGSPSGGFYAPANSLSAWIGAKAASASQPVEVLYIGDSTGFGEGGEPPPYILRELSTAAGLTDGGLGVIASTLQTTPLGLNSPPFVAAESTAPAGRDVYDAWDLLGEAQRSDMAGPEVWVWHGAGTQVRVIQTSIGNIGQAPWTLTLDNGTLETLTANVIPDRSRGNYYTRTITGLADTDHRVSLGVAPHPDGTTRADFRFALHFRRDTGIVWNRLCVPGIQSHYGAGSQANYLLGLTGADQWGNNPVTIEASDPARPPRAKLAIWALGINDQQGGDRTTAELRINLQKFIDKATVAGCSIVVCINHFEGAGYAQYAADCRAAVREVTLAYPGVALCVLGGGGALGDPATWVANGYIGTMGNPHLPEAGYRAQMNYLWGNLLNA